MEEREFSTGQEFVGDEVPLVRRSGVVALE